MSANALDIPTCLPHNSLRRDSNSKFIVGETLVDAIMQQR